MRYMLIALILLMLAPVVSRAQDQIPETATQLATANEPESYLIRLTEFRLKDAADFDPEAHDIATALDELKKSGKVSLMETVQASALESHETTVQFGKSVAIMMGTDTSQSGKQRPIQNFVQIGTLVKLKAIAQNGKVLLNVTYEASRLGEVQREDSPLAVLNTRCDTTALLEHGVPKLLSAASANASSYLMISVTKK